VVASSAGGIVLVPFPFSDLSQAKLRPAVVLADAGRGDWILDEESEPEPDICVVPGDPRDYRDAHPERPVLIVEVSLSRLGFDRERKGSLYARAGIADYWIVNIPDRRVEVYREPVPDGAAPFGWRYGRAVTLGLAERVSPLAAPAAAITVGDLLP
jgi:Uma2 family endonuclease